MSDPKVLILGSSAREEALKQALERDQDVKSVYVAPGNGATKKDGKNLFLESYDPLYIAQYVSQYNSITPDLNLIIVGSENDLKKGITNEFQADEKLPPVFGPTKEAAIIETDKGFSSELMFYNMIPTPIPETFHTAEGARSHIKMEYPDGRVVIKAVGPASGKGVRVCDNWEDVNKALDDILIKKMYGSAGDRVVVQERLDGLEASVVAVTNGRDFVTFPVTQDHKNLLPGDKGEMTGGMGAYGPAPIAKGQEEIFEEQFIRPTITTLKKEGIEYRGTLYFALMNTTAGWKCLEINARFPNPETIPIVMLLDEGSKLYDLFYKAAKGEQISQNMLKFKEGAVCDIVIATDGYSQPERKAEYRANLNSKILGLKEASEVPEVQIFHAGTSYTHPNFYNSGGRVLNVAAWAPNLDEAMQHANEAASKIRFENGKQIYRPDIGWKANLTLDAYLKDIGK
ncbi:MAG: phosphoribosylamine--glycine ligase [Candidatus Woesearchaeota archaeon]|nr:MAG: phosphoribosylamine--glycine ligase [Candidatus Woesearchaeota archaeon]